MQDSDELSSKIRDVGLSIRSKLKDYKAVCSLPPTTSELMPENFVLPTHLQHLLSCIAHGDTTMSARINPIGQDLIYCARNGRILMPKYVLLPISVKSMTGNMELIKILNRLGHGVSYSKMSEIDTAYAINKVSADTALVPEGIVFTKQASLVYDNIDRVEETISGAGKTHRVNGIVVQKPFIGPQPLKSNTATTKTKQRSIAVIQTTLPIYNVGVRPDPPILPDVDAIVEKMKFDLPTKKNLIWMICRYLKREDQTVSSWTGFNIQTRKDNCVLKDSIEYLPTIDSPATAMNTVYKILTEAVKTKESLDLGSIVVVFDQAIHAKALDIMWKNVEQFISAIPRLGAFHTTMVLLNIIGNRFGNAGLKDVIIESGVIEEGSTKKVLDGSIVIEQ